MPILEAQAVYKTYVARGVETPALLGVDLSVDDGEFSVLAGPSGSGKTTLLNLRTTSIETRTMVMNPPRLKATPRGALRLQP